MDKHLLEQYTDLLAEQADLKKRIDKSNRRLEQLEQQTVCDSVKGGYRGNQHFHIEGYPSRDVQREMDRLKHSVALYENVLTRCSLMLKKVDEFITSVDNSRMRRIMMYRYSDKLTWNEVAIRMGGRATEDSVRKELDRFLKGE